jgi:hypothetical protein
LRLLSTRSSHTECSSTHCSVSCKILLMVGRVLTKTGLQQEQPALYENLTKNLNPDEQQVVQSAVHQADVVEQALAQAAAAAANGNPAPPQ